jgi:hypothetical protein
MNCQISFKSLDFYFGLAVLVVFAFAFMLLGFGFQSFLVGLGINIILWYATILVADSKTDPSCRKALFIGATALLAAFFVFGSLSVLGVIGEVFLILGALYCFFFRRHIFCGPKPNS